MCTPTGSQSLVQVCRTRTGHAASPVWRTARQSRAVGRGTRSPTGLAGLCPRRPAASSTLETRNDWRATVRFCVSLLPATFEKTMYFCAESRTRCHISLFQQHTGKLVAALLRTLCSKHPVHKGRRGRIRTKTEKREPFQPEDSEIKITVPWNFNESVCRWSLEEGKCHISVEMVEHSPACGQKLITLRPRFSLPLSSASFSSFLSLSPSLGIRLGIVCTFTQPCSVQSQGCHLRTHPELMSSLGYQETV